FLQGRGVADNAGQQANDRIEQRDRRRLATREDEIAEAELFDLMRLDHALVDAFEAAAEQPHARPFGQRSNARLSEARPARRKTNRWTDRRRLIKRAIDHIGPHHHARPATERRVIDRAMTVLREIADIDRLDLPDLLG